MRYKVYAIINNLSLEIKKYYEMDYVPYGLKFPESLNFNEDFSEYPNINKEITKLKSKEHATLEDLINELINDLNNEIKYTNRDLDSGVEEDLLEYTEQVLARGKAGRIDHQIIINSMLDIVLPENYLFKDSCINKRKVIIVYSCDCKGYLVIQPRINSSGKTVIINGKKAPKLRKEDVHSESLGSECSLLSLFLTHSGFDEKGRFIESTMYPEFELQNILKKIGNHDYKYRSEYTN